MRKLRIRNRELKACSHRSENEYTLSSIFVVFSFSYFAFAYLSGPHIVSVNFFRTCGPLISTLISLFAGGNSSGSRGAEGGHAPPGPVKISHKKDGCRRRPHRFHVSLPPYPAAGSATG